MMSIRGKHHWAPWTIEPSLLSRVQAHMPSYRHITLLLVLLPWVLRAQQGASDRHQVAEVFRGGSPKFSSSADSAEFAQFQERNMSHGGSYNVPSRSKNYRMVWHMHEDADRCTIVRGDGQTLKDFQDSPPPGYTTSLEKPTAYGSWCAVVVMTANKPFQQERWYFEGP